MFNANKAIIALALVLALVFGLTACGQGTTLVEPPDATANVSDTPEGTTTPNPSVTPEATASPMPSDFRRATLYYRTDEGYMLPVSVEIPMEEGIAKACLSRLVSTPEMRLELQKQGLRPVIPEGTEIELNILNGTAIVNLVNMPALSTTEDEQAMFMAIVNTLVEFSTVDNVTIYFDGNDEQTQNGSNLPKNHGRFAINPENSELATSGSASPMLLYFPNESGSMCVPVTRYTESMVDLYSSIKALADGTKLAGLRSCFPENTLVLGATIENGILTVNLSSDFEQITNTVGLYDIASSVVLLTAQQFGSIDEVRFMVNGTVFEP